jgi:hypothetical protein
VRRNGIEKRIEALEAEVLLGEDPPELVMSSLIWAEWARDWKDTGIERIEEAVADVIARFKARPETAEYGGLLESYKDVIVDELYRRMKASPQSGDVEYEEAAG